MSVENVKKFYEALSQDESLKQKFVELSQKYQGQPMSEAKVTSLMEQEALPLAQQMGYSFTMDDLKSYGEEMQQAGMNRELCDEDMQAVAGGSFLCVIGGGGGGVVCVFLGFNDWVGTQDPKFCFLTGFGG